MPVLDRLADPRVACAAILAVASATIGGALLFEHGLGLVPCKLCLFQRDPYYLAMAVAAIGILLGPGRGGRAALGLLALTFLVSAGLGLYHSGVEWGWWLGPSDCGGGTGPAASSVGDFMKSLERTRVVSCTEAAWRFLGLSLAGWNAVISLALTTFAVLSLGRRQGSSSVSQ